jgi:hypothetical protein
MATIHLDPGTTYTDQATPALRRPLFPAIRWGAVLAGVAVGVSTQLVLTLLGIASGLSATSVAAGETPGIGPLVWAGVSMLVAAFVGGYVAARMTGLKRKVDGILHGVVAWAVTTLLFATLASSAGGAMLSGVFTAVNPAGMVAGSTAGGGNASGLAAMLKSRVGANASPTTLQSLEQLIQSGRRDEAIRFMSTSMGVDRTRATTIVDQALIVSGSPERASPQAREAADRALGAASTAAWTVFLAVALSLALGIAGGALGALAARRTTWTERGGASDRVVVPSTPASPNRV